MRMTKFTHACVRFEKEAGDSRRVLVIDPGNFSEVEEALAGAGAFLVTHEHADHLDVDRAAAVLESTADLQAWAPARSAEALRSAAPSAASRVHTVEPGSEFEAAGFAVRTFGSQHALIHPSVPLVANIGYLVDGEVFHPGDSFTVPHGLAVKTLLVPIHAPWSKVSEVLDFLIAVRAEKAFPVHNALLNERGMKIVEGHAARIATQYGTEYVRLEPGRSADL